MYLSRRFYIAMTIVILIIASGFALPLMFTAGRVLLAMLILAVVADIGLLYNWRPTRRSQIDNSKSGMSKSIQAIRYLPERFSNGDDNEVKIRVESNYGFKTHVEVIDEIPFVFQRRDICFQAKIAPLSEATITYMLRPTERGAYGFGLVRIFVSTPLGLVQRRFSCCEPKEVKVYPSYLMLRQYELLAMSNNLTEMGIKRIRRVGHNTDFEQIKDYVPGDDYRTINWRATARRSFEGISNPRLMVNVYQEERSQQVYSVIDKGRMMQQAFEGMTLLDYAINASLVLSFVAINKQDRAGLITFCGQIETFVPASRQPGQMQSIQEALYAEKTLFGETDYSSLLVGMAHRVARRSLMILYTSFTTMTALRRQLSYLRQLSQRHRLLVVFFEDEELKQLTNSSPFTLHPSPFTLHPSPFATSPFTPSRSTESYYQRVIAEKFLYDQQLMVHTLRQYGIQALLTTPRNLSVDVINRYLDIKSRF